MPAAAAAQRARREEWYRLTRAHLPKMVTADGRAVLPQFDPPYREPVWILPALYTGPQATIDTANCMVERYLDPSKVNPAGVRETTGKEFGIFQSNAFAHCLHRFDHLLTPAAREVMTWHTEQVFKTFKGAAQPDFKFHGANDNMPMMATKGLILGGEKLRNQAAYDHGVWHLHQFRRLLSRAAWASEFNSSTYSAVTLTAVAKIATYAADAAVRALAQDIEHRLWAEILLHYHPGTRHQAGPQSRAYCIDYAGHNHAVQLVLWLAFGSELTGRDLPASYFAPAPGEVLHFSGNPYQSIAEFCEMVDTDLHVPPSLAPLITERRYPARLRGRSECMGRYDGQGAVYHTETYMEREFSLGTVDGPMCGGEQTASLYLTYQRRPAVKTYRDAATVFFKYLTADADLGANEQSVEGLYAGEQFISSQGWCYALQHENVALLLTTPNLKNAPLTTDTLKLALIFPAHFGTITASLIGAGPERAGAVGESANVVPVSVAAGEVYIHIQPLLPTSLPRGVALRFRHQHAYEVLELINYAGPARAFNRRDLAAVLNGLVLTVAPRTRWASLAAFHAAHAAPLITDYWFADHRFFQFQRADVELEVVLTTDPFGIQTESINGRAVPRPVFESNQLDVNQLPFMQGPVARNQPLFPWGDSLEAWPYAQNSWLIGARGLPGEVPYSHRVQALKPPLTT